MDLDLYSFHNKTIQIISFYSLGNLDCTCHTHTHTHLVTIIGLVLGKFHITIKLKMTA